jgi:hypothetical protein
MSRTLRDDMFGGGISGRRLRCGISALGPHVSQLGSLHSSGAWVRVVRRCPAAGRCFDDTEALREGFWRGLLSLLCCLESPPADLLDLGAGLCETGGAAEGARVGGFRDVLGAESALLLEAAV